MYLKANTLVTLLVLSILCPKESGCIYSYTSKVSRSYAGIPHLIFDYYGLGANGQGNSNFTVSRLDEEGIKTLDTPECVIETWKGDLFRIAPASGDYIQVDKRFQSDSYSRIDRLIHRPGWSKEKAEHERSALTEIGTLSMNYTNDKDLYTYPLCSSLLGDDFPSCMVGIPRFSIKGMSADRLLLTQAIFTPDLSIIRYSWASFDRSMVIGEKYRLGCTPDGFTYGSSDYLFFRHALFKECLWIAPKEIYHGMPAPFCIYATETNYQFPKVSGYLSITSRGTTYTGTMPLEAIDQEDPVIVIYTSWLRQTGPVDVQVFMNITININTILWPPECIHPARGFTRFNLVGNFAIEDEVRIDNTNRERPWLRDDLTTVADQSTEGSGRPGPGFTFFTLPDAPIISTIDGTTQLSTIETILFTTENGTLTESPNLNETTTDIWLPTTEEPPLNCTLPDSDCPGCDPRFPEWVTWMFIGLSLTSISLSIASTYYLRALRVESGTNRW